MKGNYNVIAPFYDCLSRLVYGDAIVNAQRFLVKAIYANSAVLIVGGGTGWILEEIANIHAEGLNITYVDVSEKMIVLARKRNCGGNKVTFVRSDIRKTVWSQSFDIVITPFVLDNFSTAAANLVFAKLHTLLRAGGLWLFADFQLTKNSRLWQKVLLKIMYFFFKVVSNIEADRLPDTNTLFITYRYQLVSSNTSFQNFMRSDIYKKG